MQNNWLLQKKFLRFLALNAIVAIAYVVCIYLSQNFASLPGPVAAVWFPSAMTLALVYRLGDRVLLGIILGSVFGVTSTLLQPLPIFSIILINIACALGNTLQPLIATYLIKKFARHQNIFDHVNTVVLYILAAIFSPAISATLGITSICITGLIPWSSYGLSWVTWWLASALAHLIFTPAILLWKNAKKVAHKPNYWEISLGLIFFLFVSSFVFGLKYRLEYLFLPILIWTVLRYGSFYSSLFVSLVSLIAIIASVNGYGFSGLSSENESLLLLQSFMGTFSLTSLILSAVINERQEADSSLKKALENLELKVIERTQKLEQSEAQIDGFFSSAPIGMGIIDHNLRYLRVNQVLAEINRKSIKEHLGNSIQEVLPELGLDVEELFYQVLRTGKPLVNVEVSSNTLSPTKTEQTWLTSYFPIFDVEHIPLSVGFVVIEITDRKMIEAKLIEAKSILAYANLELEKLVNLDGLTQIANRRCFNDRLELEWERLAREQQPLALLLFDIDYFKRYNDCYGHQIGDDCLILIAQTATKSVQRPADLVARYGGEEFVVVLPNTDLEGAIGVAHEIQNAIMKLAIPHQNSDISDIVTISLGVTSLLPNRDQKSSILIKQADIALYNAKNQGRNCLVSFSNINL